MSNRKHRLTLGELIRVVSQYSRNDVEMNLAVADLMNRGVVRNTKQAAQVFFCKFVEHQTEGWVFGFMLR